MEEVDGYTLQEYISVVFQRMQLLQLVRRIKTHELVSEVWDNYCEFFVDFWAKNPAEGMRIPPSLVTLERLNNSKFFIAQKDYINAFEALGIFSSFDLYCMENSSKSAPSELLGTGDPSSMIEQLHATSVNLMLFLRAIKDGNDIDTLESMMYADFLMRYSTLYSINNDFSHDGSVEIFPEYNSFLPNKDFWYTVTSAQKYEEKLCEQLKNSKVFNESFTEEFTDIVSRAFAKDEMMRTFMREMMKYSPGRTGTTPLILQKGL